MQKTITFFFSILLLLSAASSQVVINEIMFNPYYETTPGDVSTYSTDDDGEFVELFNAGQSDVDMSCLLYTSPSPRDLSTSRMPSSA